MNEIRDLLKAVELHDSCFQALKLKGDGTLEIEIDFDEVWNSNIVEDINGLVLYSVYEISDLKIDRVNIIGSVNVEYVENYDKTFVTYDSIASNKVAVLTIDFVAGGMIKVVFSGSCDYLRAPNNSSHSAN